MDPRLMIGASGPQLGGISRNILKRNNNLEQNRPNFAGLLQHSLLSSENQEIRISAHAQKRMSERSIEMNTDLKNSLNSAMDSLSKKGARDSLVITDKGAFLVNVPNRTLVTAMGKDEMRDGIITKIDSVSMKYK